MHTSELPVVQDMADLYRSIDGPATAALLVKLAIDKAYNDKMDETRNAFQVRQGPIHQRHAAAWASTDPVAAAVTLP